MLGLTRGDMRQWSQQIPRALKPIRLGAFLISAPRQPGPQGHVWLPTSAPTTPGAHPEGLAWFGGQEAGMASARITRQWDDGTAMVVEVEADGQHPDLLDEIVRRVIQLDREAAPEAEE